MNDIQGNKDADAEGALKVLNAGNREEPHRQDDVHRGGRYRGILLAFRAHDVIEGE